MSFNQVENHFEPFLRYIDCEVVLNICSLLSIVQISRLYLERQARPRRGLQHHFRRQRAKQSPSPCPPLVKKIRQGFTREGWLHIVSAKNNSFLLIYNSSSVSFRTWYIMCPWKIHPQWNCLNSRSSADVTGTVSAEGDLDWCGIWHEGNGSPLSVGKLSVKCCHCIKACLCVHTPKCVCMHLRVREHVRACLRVCGIAICMSLYDSVCIYASLSWGCWSWEQLAETAAADRNKQLNMGLCWMNWVCFLCFSSIALPQYKHHRFDSLNIIVIVGF